MLNFLRVDTFIVKNVCTRKVSDFVSEFEVTQADGTSSLSRIQIGATILLGRNIIDFLSRCSP